MLRYSDIEFEEKMTEMELLAQVGGNHIQQLVKKEVTTMWVTGPNSPSVIFF